MFVLSMMPSSMDLICLHMTHIPLFPALRCAYLKPNSYLPPPTSTQRNAFQASTTLGLKKKVTHITIKLSPSLLIKPSSVAHCHLWEIGVYCLLYLCP